MDWSYSQRFGSTSDYTTILLRREVVNSNRNPEDFEIVVIIYPNVSGLRVTQEERRSAFTGTIGKIGNDIDRLKKMGVGHIILNYNGPCLIEDDMNAIIDTSKQIMTYAK